MGHPIGTGDPFPEYYTHNEEESSQLVDHLQPNPVLPHLQKAGCETWSCAWAPDGSYFAWSCGSRIVKLIPWNRYKHKIVQPSEQQPDHPLVTIDTGELVWAVAFGSSNSDTRSRSIHLNWGYQYHCAKRDLILATGLDSGRIRTWDVVTGQLMLELVDHRQVIRDLKFAPDGSLRLASASRDGSLKLWNLCEDGNMYKTLTAKSKWIYSCAWSPDAHMLVSVGNNRSVLLWDMVTLKLLRSLEGHHHDVCSCDFSPDGALLATSSYDTRIIVWDPHTGEQLLQLCHMFPPPSPIFAGGANGAYVRGVSFCHDGRHIASVADDRYVRFWDIFNPSLPEQVAEVNNALCCSYSPDGAVLAVGNRNGSVSFWLSPMQVLSLQHLCRMSVRRVLASPKVGSLYLPARLKRFLRYLDPQSTTESTSEVFKPER